MVSHCTSQDLRSSMASGGQPPSEKHCHMKKTSYISDWACPTCCPKPGDEGTHGLQEINDPPAPISSEHS